MRTDDGQPYMSQQTPQTMVEYTPLGVPSPASLYQDEFKAWKQHQRSQRYMEIQQCPGMEQGRIGVVEVDGGERPAETPTAEQ